MLGVARRRETYAFLQQHGSATVTQIAALLDVSSQTVRRDLDSLTEEGLVARVHGGAVIVETAAGGGPAVEGAPAERAAINAQAKRRIGAAAAGLVRPGSTIFLSGGTTTAHVVPWLGSLRRLTVVTNAVNVVAALARFEEIQVIVLPGTLRHREMTLLGPQAVEAIGHYDVEHALYGCYGLDAPGGVVFGASPAEAVVDRAIIDAVARVTVLADHDKLTQRGPVRIATAERITSVVTDVDAPEAPVSALRDQDVEVLLA